MPKQKFPETLFVDIDHESECFLADETPNSKEDGVEVAVYQLVEVKTMKVTYDLISKTRR